MCCSLYDENSASVDIRCARKHNIIVKGVNDYGDNGVGEYVVAELSSLLHGFHGKRWDERSFELTGFPVGIIGMGATGKTVAKSHPLKPTVKKLHSCMEYILMALRC